MKKLLIYFFMIATPPSVWSQNGATNPRADIATQSNLNSLGKGRPILQTFDDRYDGIKGNRFFYDDQYHEGELVLTDSTLINNQVLYRLDQLLGAVQVKYPDGKEIYLKTNNILIFRLKVNSQDVFFKRSVMPDNLRQYRLLQVIYYSPTLKLLRDSRKKLSRVNDTGAYSKGEVYDEIENDFRYCIQRGDNAPIEVKPSRKSFIRAMPDLEKKIEHLFNTSRYKSDLTVSKLAELMKKLDEAIKSKSGKE